MEHSLNGDIKQTVIYSVKIIAANKSAWYKFHIRETYDCLLEIVDKPLGGQEIMFRCVDCYHPLKFIKLQHAKIIKQRFADHSELTKYYGK
jgi:hypothetical protein